jgi:GT2 family glycosyltransferase
MTCGVVIVAWNGEQYLDACLRSVLEQSVVPAVIIVIDNGSDDRSLEIIGTYVDGATRRGVTLRVVTEPTNTGFTPAANKGLAALRDEFRTVDVAILLNQDVTLDGDWCEVVSAAFAADPQVGVVGSKLLRPNRLTIQHAGGYLERPRFVGRHYGHHEPAAWLRATESREVEFVTGAAIALRVAALDETGTFDEVFAPGYYEDVDLCLRMTAKGWKVVYLPTAVATHVESASFGRRPDRLSIAHRNRLIFALPWLVDETFRGEFYRHEHRFAKEASLEERRALALGYLSVLLMLPEALDARVGVDSVSAATCSELIEMLASLRRDISVAPERSRRAPSTNVGGDGPRRQLPRLQERPRVSIILPFLNASRFMDEAITSVFNQTYSSWELLLVDDGSTDASTVSAVQLSAEHPGRIRYLEHHGHANRGPSASRNVGLANARGEYVAFIDADDIWLPDKLRKQVAILDEHPDVAMVYGPLVFWYGWTGDPKHAARDFVCAMGSEFDRSVDGRKMLLRQVETMDGLPGMCSVLLRREIVTIVGGFEESFRMYEDEVFFSKIALQFPVYVMGEPLDRYRQHPDSACARAIAAGEYAPTQGPENKARAAYLQWLLDFVTTKGHNGDDLQEAIRKQLALYGPR